MRGISGQEHVTDHLEQAVGSNDQRYSPLTIFKLSAETVANVATAARGRVAQRSRGH